MAFSDHFSTQSSDYARFRPTYPAALFDWVAGLAPARDAVWDCATGNGQAAVALADRFARVRATDGSAAQLSNATRHPRVAYSVGTAEASGLPDRCVDAITVAQAAHWFDLRRFVAECRRTGRPGAPVVLWGYTVARVAPEIDALLEPFYAAIEPYWPRGRERLDAGYHRLEWSLADVPAPPFEMVADWTAEHYLGYVSTWSAVVACDRATTEHPVDPIADAVREAWGDAPRRVVWRMTLRAGRLPA